MIDVNVGAALWLTQAVVPYLRDRGSGAIVHVASRPGLEPAAGMAASAVSKAALVYLTRVLDLELRPLGIRVYAVGPQILDTAKNRQYLTPDLLAHAVAPEAVADIIVRDVVRIGQVQARQLLASENDPARPVPDVTFETRHTLTVGGERVNLAWHGANHTPDNSYIHFPGHDTPMLVDIFLPGWVPFDSFNLNQDVPGSIAAADTALAYPWTHFIGGHMGRLGTRADMVPYQQYVNDIIDGVKKALAAVDPTPFFVKYGNNVWAASQQYLATVVAYASGPVINKYLGVLAAADVYTASTTFAILESVRLDLGFGSQVHA